MFINTKPHVDPTPKLRLKVGESAKEGLRRLGARGWTMPDGSPLTVQKVSITDRQVVLK